MKRRHLAVTGLLACAAALAAAPPQPTTAAWAFPEYASGSFEAGTVLPPTWVSCSKSGLTVFTFRWAAPPTGGATRTGYSWTVKRGTQLVSGPTFTDQMTLVVDSGLLPVGDLTVTLVATGTGEWTSTAISGTVSSLGLSCSI
jgi:hypothetical protein